MRDYFVARAETPDWELAFAHTIHAHAAAAAGRKAEQQTSYELATAAVAAIADPEDRAIVMQTFLQVPKP